MSLGVPKGRTFLVPHDPAWAELFEEERRRLLGVLQPEVVEVQHIGSTAIPGIHAKPIIDILVGTPSYVLADDWQDRMASLGYDYPGDIGIPEHRVFGRDREIRRFLVHVVDLHGLPWRRLVRFRNVLLRDPHLAVEYERLKLEAAAKYPIGLRSKYTDEKADFIAEVLSRHPE